MKNLFYTLVFVLIGLSFFTVAYIGGNKFVSLKGVIKAATVLRFVEPKEIKATYDLMDRLPAERNGTAILDKNGQSLLYYHAETGYLHHLEPASEVKDTLLQRLHPHLNDLQWSADRTKILASNGAEYVYYDLSTGSSRTLSKSVISPTFSPSGKQIAYISYESPETGAYLGLSDLNFEFFKKLIPVSQGEWSVSWPEEKTLALQYSSNGKSSFFVVDIETGSLTRVLNNLSELKTKWSKDGQALLYSYRNQNDELVLAYRLLFAINNDFILPISTSASKCAWSSNKQTVYCSKPKDDPQDGEKFVVINLRDSSVKNLRTSSVNKIKAENLLLSADEKYLFFKNSLNGNLYRLKIEIDQ